MAHLEMSSKIFVSEILIGLKSYFESRESGNTVVYFPNEADVPARPSGKIRPCDFAIAMGSVNNTSNSGGGVWKRILDYLRLASNYSQNKGNLQKSLSYKCFSQWQSSFHFKASQPLVKKTFVGVVSL